MMRERCPDAKFLTLAGAEMNEVFEALKNEAMTDQGSLFKVQTNTRNANNADGKSD